MTVVAAFELDQKIAPRIAACQPDGAHRRLGTGTDEPHHVHRWQKTAEQIGQFDFTFGRRAERQTVGSRGLNGGNHFRMGMTEDQGAPGTDVIEIFVAIRIRHARAASFGKETRDAADRAESTHRRIDATGDMSAGTFEQGRIAIGHENAPSDNFKIGTAKATGPQIMQAKYRRRQRKPPMILPESATCHRQGHR